MPFRQSLGRRAFCAQPFENLDVVIRPPDGIMKLKVFGKPFLKVLRRHLTHVAVDMLSAPAFSACRRMFFSCFWVASVSQITRTTQGSSSTHSPGC